MVANNRLSSCPTEWRRWVGRQTLALWLICCRALLCSGLIYLPECIGNNNAVNCCVQIQSCYARLTFPENCKRQWTVYLLSVVVYVPIDLSIHPSIHPKVTHSLRLLKCCTSVSVSLFPFSQELLFWQFTKLFVSLYKVKNLIVQNR